MMNTMAARRYNMPEHILRRYARGLMSIPPEISMADLLRMILYFVENNFHLLKLFSDFC